MTNSLVLDFVTKIAVVGNNSQLVLPMRLGQTKRTNVGLWCEDDSNALGLGIFPLPMVVVANSAMHHGQGKNPGWNLSEISTIAITIGKVQVLMLQTNFHVISYSGMTPSGLVGTAGTKTTFICTDSHI